MRRNPTITNDATMEEKELREYRFFELKQVLERIISLEEMRQRNVTFIGTANLTALGLAFLYKSYGIIFVAAMLIVIYLVFEQLARRQHQIFYYRGLQLQRLLSHSDAEVYLELHPSIIAREARRLLTIEDVVERKEALSGSKAYKKGLFIFTPVVLLLIEIIGGFITKFCFQWVFLPTP